MDFIYREEHQKDAQFAGRIFILSFFVLDFFIKLYFLVQVLSHLSKLAIHPLAC